MRVYGVVIQEQIGRTFLLWEMDESGKKENGTMHGQLKGGNVGSMQQEWDRNWIAEGWEIVGSTK